MGKVRVNYVVIFLCFKIYKNALNKCKRNILIFLDYKIVIYL